MRIELTSRQREILRRVVEEYVGSGQPVGSKHLVERSQLRVSSSTVRYELAELEELGFLTHPHTSAGRVPTERGYRLYVDELLEQLEPRPARFELDLSTLRSEVESALQATTDALADVTSLLALVSARTSLPSRLVRFRRGRWRSSRRTCVEVSACCSACGWTSRSSRRSA